MLKWYTIYSMWSKEAQIGHADVHGRIFLAYLNDRHATEALLVVVRVGFLNLVQEEIVHHMDKLEMPRENFSHNVHWPLLQEFVARRVRGVGKGLAGDKPSLVQGEAFLIY